MSFQTETASFNVTLAASSNLPNNSFHFIMGMDFTMDIRRQFLHLLCCT